MDALAAKREMVRRDLAEGRQRIERLEEAERLNRYDMSSSSFRHAARCRALSRPGLTDRPWRRGPTVGHSMSLSRGY